MTVVQMPLWEILVPHKMGEHDNTDPRLPKRNRNIPVPYHQEWDAFVREVTGGLTIQRAAKGQWTDNTGKLYKEIMIPVRIACTEDQIKKIAEFTLSHYKQKAVFVTLVSEKTLIFHAEGEAPETDPIVAVGFWYAHQQALGVGDYCSDVSPLSLSYLRKENPGIRFKPIYASDNGRWKFVDWTQEWCDAMPARGDAARGLAGYHCGR